MVRITKLIRLRILIAVVPVALEAVAVFGDGQVSGQTHGGAEELRRAFPLECRLAFQQDLQQTRRKSGVT